MNKTSMLALSSALCIALGLLPIAGSAQAIRKPSAPTAKSTRQAACERAYQQFFSAEKTMKLKITRGYVTVEPDNRKFNVTKQATFKFVGFTKITVNGAGTIEKSFPNGEFGGRVSFDGVGTIEYDDSGSVEADGVLVLGDVLEYGLKLTADRVTKVDLVTDVQAITNNCKFVNAYRNSQVTATNCESVSAYTKAVATVRNCKRVEAEDGGRIVNAE